MKAQLTKWAACGTFVCSFFVFGMPVPGQAGAAQSPKAAFCSAMTQVADADADVVMHPTKQHVQRLSSDLRRAVAALPPLAANRTQLSSLITTNLFGQNASVIASTEQEYAEMWAQDAEGMYGYTSSSSVSSVSTKLAPVASYVEHACPNSGTALKNLNASDHQHGTSSTGP
jgi:predicted RNA-binding Zn-ribbon protein involved in translation (DUF1610 family)